MVAVDLEAPAVDATRANAAANGVAIEARLADALLEQLPPAELVVANIALGAVTALAARIDAPRLVSSGYLAGDRPELEGYESQDRRELDGWAADLFTTG